MHDLAAYRVYSDDGVSGTVPLDQRPEGGKTLKDAQFGKFDQLLVDKLDRLGRETRLILNAVADLLRRPKGATLTEITKATDWQNHSIRGFISGNLTKKMGLKVESTKSEAGERTYRIAK